MKYLVAIDGSEQAHKAFEITQNLYKDGDQVLVMTNCKPSESDKADALLNKYEDMAKDSHFHMPNFDKVVCQESDARKGILQAIERYHIDVLVMGTRGMGAIKRTLIGSVGSHVIDNANCDILIAK